MYKDFIIKKQSGTYAETLEAYGIANLINEILIRSDVLNNVIVEDKETFYVVSSNKEITEEMVGKLKFFQILKFILKDQNQEIPDGVIDFYDYPKQNIIRNNFKTRFNEIDKNKQLSIEQKKAYKKSLKEEVNGEKLDLEYDVYREIQGNINYPNFTTIFNLLNDDRISFNKNIGLILNYYSTLENDNNKELSLDTKEIIALKNTITPIQIYNPNQGKGTNKIKANGFDLSKNTIKSNWISESMKISGSLSFMVCQYVKVGAGYDMKVFVPEFKQINITEAKNLLLDFKKNLKSVSPIKLDLLNIMNLSTKFIQRTPNYNQGKIKNTIKGFHSVYQKELGQNKAVSNIAFISVPDFIEYSTKEEGRNWIDILEQQKSLIANIEELGDSIPGLINYRNFLGSTSYAALNNFNRFSHWYSGYLMQQLTKGNNFIRTFTIDSLTKLYNFMEPSLTEIIHNDGFKAVAKAIRNSTIKLQKTSNFQITHKRFQIRYGLAQELNNKSKSKTDFTAFIGEFLAKYDAETAKHKQNYDAETAKHKQNNESIRFRPNVREDEKDKFFELLDIYPSKLVGALLSSYGFALEKYEKSDDDRLQQLQEAASKLGYQLIKIEEQIKENEIDQMEELENN